MSARTAAVFDGEESYSSFAGSNLSVTTNSSSPCGGIVSTGEGISSTCSCQPDISTYSLGLFGFLRICGGTTRPGRSPFFRFMGSIRFERPHGRNRFGLNGGQAERTLPKQKVQRLK